MSDGQEITLNPEPNILIESLRDVGYSFESALADIIDNSISANARNVQVEILPVDDFQVSVLDDGEGLDRDDLLQAMKLGSTDPRQDRQINDLGRFGLGLKTASFSQCRRLTVVSKRDSKLSAFTWDLDTVVRENEWTVIERDDISNIPHADEMGEQGTLVLWEKADRITGEGGSGKIDYDRIISEAEDHLSLVFHRFLSGEPGIKRLNITVNNRQLDPIDPFNASNHATQSQPKETVCPGVTLQAFTLPHRSCYSTQAEYEKYGLPGGYLRNQGVYLYRAKRLIMYGTWFGLGKKTALTQLSRVKIDIDVNQDETWKIDVKKVSAQMPEIVRKRLKELINSIGAPSKKIYRNRGAKLTNDKVYPTWNAEKTKTGVNYYINREHPVIATLRDNLNENSEELDAVLGLIETTFPKEAIYYDLSNHPDDVHFRTISETELRNNAKNFFATLQQQGKKDEEILSIMKFVAPFNSNWEATLKALNIEEE